ncbi:MAG: T9SS type A sorting domain-containing protein [Flavobacteriales bacterium]
MYRNLTPVLYLTVHGLCAQPTVPQLGFSPGTTIVLDSEFPITSPGASGANITWDLSTAAFSGANYTYTAQDISSVPGAGQFPNANAVYQVDLTNGFSGYYFFDYTVGFTDHGELINGTGLDLVAPYSDPMTYCTTPIVFGGNGSDTYAFASTNNTITSNTTGTITWNVDAYGTLLLPNATYTNVLRVRTLEVETTTTSIGGFPITNESQEETWLWFKAGYPLPLLTYSVITDDFGTEPGATAAIVSFSGSTGLIEGPATPLLVQPNPAGPFCYVQFPGLSDPQVRLLDATGQVLFDQRLKGFEPKVQIDLEDRAPGVYLVQAITPDGVQSARIVHP